MIEFFFFYYYEYSLNLELGHITFFFFTKEIRLEHNYYPIDIDGSQDLHLSIAYAHINCIELLGLFYTILSVCKHLLVIN